MSSLHVPWPVSLAYLAVEHRVILGFAQYSVGPGICGVDLGLLSGFAKVVDRLVELAENTYSQVGVTFEQGIARAYTAVLASPRFLFRFEDQNLLRNLHTLVQITEKERYVKNKKSIIIFLSV